jgi:hypothetical protein
MADTTAEILALAKDLILNHVDTRLEARRRCLRLMEQAEEARDRRGGKRCARCGDEDLPLNAQGYCLRIEECLIRLDQRVSAFARDWWRGRDELDPEGLHAHMTMVGDKFADWVDRRSE